MVKGCKGIDQGFSRVVTVTSVRAASDRSAAATTGRVGAKGSSTKGRTCPPRRSMVQTGRATGVAMPSWAFLAKPFQASSKRAYIRHEVRHEPLAAKEPRELDAVVDASMDGCMAAAGAIGVALHEHELAAGRAQPRIAGQAHEAHGKVAEK